MNVAALMVAASGLMLPTIAGATAPRPDADIMTQYVRARLADSAGDPSQAIANYGPLLAQYPGDIVMAMRTYRVALAAGDMTLALQAAQLLDNADALPPDGELLLLAHAMQTRDRAAANRMLQRIEAQSNFNFLVPILRAWLEFGVGEKGASAILEGRFPNALTTAYSGEHRMLLLLAEKRTDEAMTAFRAMTSSGGIGVAGTMVRVSAAGRLVSLRERDAAKAVLEGADPALRAASALAGKGKKLPDPVDNAATGVALLLARLASDISRQQPSPVALSLAQSAAYLSPRNDGIKLLVAAMRAGHNDRDGALSLLGTIDPKGPWSADARDAQVHVLADAGKKQEALDLALSMAASDDSRVQDFTRLGEIYMSLEQPADAALAYERAIMLAEKEDGAGWALWLFKGSAQHEAGQWPAARDALAKAVELAPEQAVALNYLGYAQLERRENLDEAEALIRKASELRPDDSAITDSLGWTYFVRGKIPEAIETLERAARGEPGEPTINEHLGDAYWKAGRKIEARYSWRAALIMAEDEVAERIRSKIDFGLTTENVSP